MSTTTLRSPAPGLQRLYQLSNALRSSTAPSLVTQYRSKSTTSSPPTEPRSSESASNISWPAYFDIRRSKRRWEMATTFPASIAGLTAGIAYFGSLEATGPIFGIDPLWVYGAATVGCTGLGWLLGPFIGGSFWRVSHRKALAAIEKRDREFYHHIVKNRVDATLQSPVTPVPDYYGEKVGSLHQYRHWLRDQNRYRRKRLGDMADEAM